MARLWYDFQMEIVFASHNLGKLAEMKKLLDLEGFRLVSVADFNYQMDVEETGKSYLENARIKAEYVHRLLPEKIILADDSGLSVDLLDGYPGIYSARFAGEDSPYSDKIHQLWHLLDGTPKDQWTASFHCALVLIFPDGREKSFVGSVSGFIADQMAGQNGFGYDPVFYLPAYHKTMAELRPEEKNQISHRALAAKKLGAFLQGQGAAKT